MDSLTVAALFGVQWLYESVSKDDLTALVQLFATERPRVYV